MKVHVVQRDDELEATLETGEKLVSGDARDLGARLRALGVRSEDVTMPDWREGDIAPLGGAKIALFMALKGLHQR